MKKRVFLLSVVIGLFLLMLVVQFATAQENDSNGDIIIDTLTDEQSKIDKAYKCLEDKIKDKCDKLSSEERIFSVLATGKCKTEVNDDSKNDECWPESGCNIKTTAQAILALDKSGAGTTKAEEWLLSQNTSLTDIEWFLQIESPQETTCKISYSDSSYQIVIGADKKISSGAGSCLSLSEGNYWLRVSQTCYDKEFEISCNQGFLTSLLYKKKTSSTIYVSEKTTSASAEGTTTEKISSICFKKPGTNNCDYEGSLWAAIVLNYLNYDVSLSVPYLVTMKDEPENSKLIAESFLYFLTGYSDYRNELLLKQKSSKYWDESGDKFYDTAVALHPMQYEEPLEKSNSKNWLLEVQDKDGCWQGNIRNTAFILYSIWPKEISEGGMEEEPDCEDSGNYCVSRINCNGNVLENYDCSGAYVCCDTEYTLPLCSEQGGEICGSGQDCIGGSIIEASDTEICCTGGDCGEQIPQETECESYGDYCRSSCFEGEEEINYDCDFGDVCCREKLSKPSYWYIWVLVILIILLILGIIFRNKIRPYWFRIKSKFSRKPKGPPPRFGPGFFQPPRAPPRMMPRRILPPQQQMQRRMPPTRKTSGELDEVLKKLKEMGK